MRRIALVLIVLAGSAFAVFATGADDPVDDQRYWVELDNAFGLIEGADVKVAGVRAGKITEMKLNRQSYRARIGIDIAQKGFGNLRKDVFCESRPQSLIGEYFLDCLPGTDKEVLKSGSTIPVKQTGSTISVDLVNNIMRRPYRERFRILITELGAAFAARGEDLNEAIRRANPALRETDKTLAILAEQRNVIRELVKNAEDVVTELADKRQDVTRFVEEARDTSQASAERADDIARQFQRFPTFLRELRPTMRYLGEAADAQTPALRNLYRSSRTLTRFLKLLGPFSEASRPAFRSLAGAARVGRPAIRSARPTIAELRRFAKPAPEVGQNLAITLEHLDNQDFAAERDARAPGGKGYSGLQALLQYVFRQSQAINLFDANSYILKVTPFLDNLCAAYATAEQAREPERQRCRAKLGPSQPGIDQPDPTKTGTRQSDSGSSRRSRGRSRARGRDGGESAPNGSAPSTGGGDAPAGGDQPRPPIDLQDTLDQIFGNTRGAPSLPGDVLPRVSSGDSMSSQVELLDFLLAP